jgi:hypothetical protein
LIASLVASGHAHDFTKYTFKPNSLLLTKQKKNSLRNERRFSQAQYQAADVCKSLPNHLSSQEKEKLYALLDKHRFLFKGTLGLPFPPTLFTSKSNPMPSLSMDAHSLFQKPMKA